jgi:hypothetical protein
MSNEKGAKAPKSNSERQAELKKKRLESGLVRVEIYATPEHKIKILEFAASLKT